MVSSIWIKDARCLCKAQETPNPKLNLHTSAFLVLEGMQLRWVWCCCWTCTAFIFCRHDLVERCMGAIFAVSTYFLLPLSQHPKGGPWMKLCLSFAFYEGRMLLLVRIQIHYLQALGSTGNYKYQYYGWSWFLQVRTDMVFQKHSFLSMPLVSWIFWIQLDTPEWTY